MKFLDLLSKIKSILSSKGAKNDYSIYLINLKKIAPITFQSLGSAKLLQILEAYFKELTINVDTLEENIFYLPIFLKKYSKKFNISKSHIEMCDYEFSCYQILNDPAQFKYSKYNELTTEVFTNPISQALRLEHDILEFDKGFKSGKIAANTEPIEKKNLLIISKNPESKNLVFIEGNITHAAILDELHDGKRNKKDLLTTLQSKYQEIPQRDWVVAFKDLKSNFVIIEQ